MPQKVRGGWEWEAVCRILNVLVSLRRKGLSTDLEVRRNVLGEEIA